MQKAEKLPEKRSDILYSRITPLNKVFLQKMADKEEISESVLVNHILDLFRTKNAGDKKKSRGSA